MKFWTKSSRLYQLFNFRNEKKLLHESILYNVSFKSLLYILMITQIVVCVGNVETLRQIRNRGERYKRQLQEEDSRPRGYAAVSRH